MTTPPASKPRPAPAGLARRISRWTLRGLAGLAALLALIVVSVVVSGWQAFGHRAEGARRARMERSPQWKNGHFENPQPLWNDWWGAMTGWRDGSHDISPATGAIWPAPVDPASYRTPPASGLRVTWFGHSTNLVEIDGRRVLTDPVWSDRPSPLGRIGPRRWYPPPLALDDLPPLDAVAISHDHYDHLDRPTVIALAELARARGWATRFIVPLGVGAHLEYWGIPAERIVELDWWEHTQIGGDLTVTCTPARHASGRMLIDKDATLWAGYAMAGTAHRAFFSGDTGLFPALRDIGVRLGPFDVTMIEAGQYNRAWPDWHIGPEQAVTAHELVRGKVMIPVHWGLLTLAYHAWTEPVERVLAAAARTGALVETPRPGASIEPGVSPRPGKWWPQIPWQTAAEAPIVSTNVN